ncbi:hypothetical protein OIU76_013342 [Salix suchowensis]|nr:hypothetical protein OIU76_013342 [Salix suchowensis]
MVGSPPRLHVNSRDHIISLAMLCEPISGELPVVKLDQPHDNTVWLDHPPPLLRLCNCGFVPAKENRKQSGGRDGIVRTPSVHPVLRVLFVAL